MALPRGCVCFEVTWVTGGMEKRTEKAPQQAETIEAVVVGFTSCCGHVLLFVPPVTLASVFSEATVTAQLPFIKQETGALG